MRKQLHCILFVSLVAILWAPSILLFVENSADPFAFNDDVRQAIVPFFSDWNSELFQNDYAVAYERALTPLGTKLVYVIASTFIPPDRVSSLLQLFLYLSLLLIMAITAFSLGDKRTMYATVLFTLSSSLFLQRIVGGLSRSFAFPLMALLALALVQQNIRLSALVLILSALFYPPIGQVSFYSLIGLCLWQYSKTERELSRRSVILLGLTASLALLFVLPLLLVQEKYGHTISLGELKNYPEADKEGRYGDDDRPPFPSVLYALIDCAGRTFQSGGRALCPPIRDWLYGRRVRGKPTGQLIVVMTVIILCLLHFSFHRIRVGKDGALNRLHILLFASLMSYFMSSLLYPTLFVPWRAIVYPIPIFLLLLFPLSLLHCVKHFAKVPERETIIFYCSLICCLVILGGRSAGDEGFTVKAHQEKALYEYLSSLPTSSLIAGFPKGVVENIPYLCQRSTLVNYETHQAFHKDYVIEMRLRTGLLLAAYFSTKEREVTALIDKYKVTHLLIDERHYFAEGTPSYFAPFDEMIKELKGSKKREDYLLLKLPSRKFGHYRLIELSELHFTLKRH